MNMFNRFTERARKVILLAKEEAKRFNHDYIGTEHILLGLIREGEGVAAAVLQNLGLSSDQIRLEVEKLVQLGPSTIVSGDIPVTPKAKKVIELAMDEARNLGHNYIGTEHLLLGLIRDGEGIATAVLQRLGLRLETVTAEVERALAGLPKTLTFGEVPFTPQAKRVLELSIEEARQLGHNYIGTEHLLLGIMKEGQSIAAKILESLGARLDEVRQETLALLGDQYYPRPKKRSQTPVLDEFARDLTQMAREGKLDPVIGRETEIERVIQILSRRTKNNPVLIGEPGVGKTAI
ncbi:MAG: hypothetical protein HYZ93_02360, partial [Candidatus Omnitrophica bacterium]|nr:hypothetical protein [Candidatus Omnitrophota bacterium]